MLGAPVLATFGWMLGLLSVAEVATALVATRFGENEAAVVLSGSSLISGFIALGLIFGFRDREIRLRRRHGLALVALVWLGVPAFAAMPFAMLGGSTSALTAYFESISAFTTTGATLFSSIDDMPRSLVFWRGFLAWSGGAATLVFAVASLDRLRWETGEGLLIFSAGLADPKRLVQASREILPFYSVLTGLCFLALLAAGFQRFDAVILSLSALSTSGIMPRQGDFSDYGSLGATYVMTVFMVVGAATFLISKAMTARRSLGRTALAEAGIGIFAILLASVLLTVALLSGGQSASGQTFAGALFSIVSLVSTSGIRFDGDTAGFMPLPAVLLIVMIGGIYGSTAGGLKIGRVLHMMRDAGRELERLVHPGAIARRSEPAGVSEAGRIVWTYFFAYLIVFAILAAITAFYRIDFEHALLWSAAMISNAGPVMSYLPAGGLDPISVIAAEGGEVLLFASIATMVLGRIEVLALLAILTPIFWRR